MKKLCVNALLLLCVTVFTVECFGTSTVPAPKKKATRSMATFASEPLKLPREFSILPVAQAALAALGAADGKISLDKSYVRRDKVDEKRNTIGLNAPILQHAIRDGEAEFALYLIKKGAPVNLADEKGLTPLHRAIETGNKTVVATLLDYGADARGGAGRPSPLSYEFNQVAVDADIVKSLVEYGADTNEVVEGTPLITRAVQKCSDKQGDVVFNVIVPGVTDINARDTAGMNSLQYAIQSEKKKLAALLLTMGANPFATDAKGRRAVVFVKDKDYKFRSQVLAAERAWTRKMQHPKA